MKLFKYIIISLILFICACGNVKTTFVPEYETHMMNEYESVYTCWQLDSICAVDSIDRDLNSWIYLPLRDKETGENVSLYMYIKSLGEHEAIYRVQEIDDCLYKITKRITK